MKYLIKGVKDAAPYLLYKIYEPKYKTDISLGGIELHHDKSQYIKISTIYYIYSSAMSCVLRYKYDEDI